MRECLVISCKNKGSRTPKTIERVKYALLPGKEPERSEWLKLCGHVDNNEKINKTSWICETHFPVELLHTTICLSLKKRFCKCKFPDNLPKPSLNLPYQHDDEVRRKRVSPRKPVVENVEEVQEIPEKQTTPSKERRKVNDTKTTKTVEKVHGTRKRKKDKEEPACLLTPPKYKKIKKSTEIKIVSVKSIADKNETEKNEERPPKRAYVKKKKISLLKKNFNEPPREVVSPIPSPTFDVVTSKATEYEIMTGKTGGEDLEVFSGDEDVESFSLDADQEPVFSLEDLCRICAQQKPDFVQIFGEEGKKQELHTKISHCLTIKVCEDDTLPLIVCKDCISKLDASFNLSATAENSEKILITFLQQQESLFNSNVTSQNIQLLPADQIFHNEEPYSPESDNGHEFDDTPFDTYESPETVPTEKSTPTPSKTSQVNNTNTITQKILCIPKNKDFTCKACNVTISTEIAAQHCLNIHKKYMCIKCHSTYPTQTDLETHEKISSNLSIVAIKKKSKFNCLICKTGFDTVKETADHCINLHNIHMCEVCFDFFTCQELLDMHMEKGHVFTKLLKNMHSKQNIPFKKEINKNDKPKHVCNVCWKIFFTSELFKKHLKTSCKETVEVTPKLQKGKKIDLSIRKFENQKTKVPSSIICSICTKTIHSIGHRSYLQEHYKLKHCALLCRICLNYFTDDFNQLKLHAAKKHKKINNLNRYKCNYCNKYYYFKSNLKLHIAKKHICIPVQYKCKICQRNFKSRATIKNHMNEEHSIIKKLTPKKRILLDTEDCNLCTEKLPSIYLKRHYKKIHNQYICTYCTNVYYSKLKLLKRHLKFVHKKIESKYICNYCNIQCNTKKELKIHILNTHISINKRYSCEPCNLQYHFKSELISHLKTHGCRKVLNCNICSQIFIKEDALNDHMKIYHNYICKICCIDLKTVHILGVHCRLYHYNNCSFICNICKSSFNSESAIIMHCQYHKPKERIKYKNNLYYKKTDYYCEICDYYFMTPTVLKLHMSNKHNTSVIDTKNRNILLNVSNFKCEYCKEQFALKESYDSHILIHTPYESFTCTYCDMVFGDQEIFNDHLYSLHNVQIN